MIDSISLHVIVTAGLESKPKLSELQRLVKLHLAKRWEELGTALGLADEDDGEQLDKIQENRNGDSSMCFNDTMKLWLRRSSASSHQPTWATLIEAIKSIEGLQAIGAQIEAQLISSRKKVHQHSSLPEACTCVNVDSWSPFVATSKGKIVLGGQFTLINSQLCFVSDGVESMGK